MSRVKRAAVMKGPLRLDCSSNGRLMRVNPISNVYCEISASGVAGPAPYIPVRRPHDVFNWPGRFRAECSHANQDQRKTEEPRVGKEAVSPCRSRGERENKKKKNNK